MSGISSAGGKTFKIIEEIDVSTLSSPSEVDLSNYFRDGYDYRITLENLDHSQNGADLRMRLESGGSINTTSVYNQSGENWKSANATTREGFEASTYFLIADNIQGDASEGVTGTLEFINPANATEQTRIFSKMGFATGTDNTESFWLEMMFKLNVAVTGLRFYTSSAGSYGSGKIVIEERQR